MDDILKGMESQEATALVALDLTLAFDMVNHNLLLVILRSHFGIDSIPLAWIKSYLNNRSFQVLVGSALLDPVEVPLCCTPREPIRSSFFYMLHCNTG